MVADALACMQTHWPVYRHIGVAGDALACMQTCWHGWEQICLLADLLTWLRKCYLRTNKVAGMLCRYTGAMVILVVVVVAVLWL